MILGHLNVVLSGRGSKKKSLMEAASGFIHEFETPVKVILG
jgi:hypothetical protein